MRTPDEYREFAAECYRWAAEAKTEAYQKMMEENGSGLERSGRRARIKFAQQR